MPLSVPTVLQVEAAALGEAQTIEGPRLTITPYAGAEPFLDVYSNACRRLMMPQGDVLLDYQVVATIPDKRGPMLHPFEADSLHLPSDLLHYLLPSRYCQSDLLGHMAQDQFGGAAPGFARVQTICDWINQHVTYMYGTTTASTSAYDTATQRQGVCRDFAHLGIAFCRAMNIPARYVSGYCLGLQPPDFHAYFQAYLDGRWVNFDATERQPRPALIQIATGRDAVDCAWCTFYGAGETKALSVEVSEVTD